MKVGLYVFLVGAILFSGCEETETEFEVETRNELSSIIRVVDNTHKNIYEIRNEVGNQSLMSSNDFYNQQSQRFQNLSENLAATPNAEKFDSVRQYLEDIISLSNEYVYAKKGLFQNTLDLNNDYKSYQDNLEDLTENTIDLDSDITSTYITNRLSRNLSGMKEDSAEFYNSMSLVEDELGQYSSTETKLISTSQELNDLLINFSFRDTLSFHKNYVFKDSLVTNIWNTLSEEDLEPTKDMNTVFETILGD